MEEDSMSTDTRTQQSDKGKGERDGKDDAKEGVNGSDEAKKEKEKCADDFEDTEVDSDVEDTGLNCLKRILSV